MRFKYGIVIVTYNRLNLLKECIEHCIHQTCPPTEIFIVDNCCTDGTEKYLNEIKEKENIIRIIHLDENTGGAGGFYKGIVEAASSDIDWVMLIDDDAILDYDCMEKMNPLNTVNKSEAYACVVKSNGKIDLNHRRNQQRQIPIEEYNSNEFVCQYATFCGLLIKITLIRRIGFPEKEYFIWFDDTEYCMRINKYSHIVVCTEACLNHKTGTEATMQGHKRASWKTYYGTRNNIHALKKHKKYWELTKTLKGTIINIFKMIKNATKDKTYINEARLFWDAMCDGLKGRLGKNEKYYPGR